MRISLSDDKDKGSDASPWDHPGIAGIMDFKVESSVGGAEAATAGTIGQTMAIVGSKGGGRPVETEEETRDPCKEEAHAQLLGGGGSSCT